MSATRWVTIAAASAIVLAGCSSGSGSSSESSSSAAASQPAASSAAAATSAASASSAAAASSAPAAGDLKIGFAIPTSKATYFTAYIEAVKAKAAELGVQVDFAFAEDDANKQNTQIVDFATAGEQGVVLAPVDVDGNVTGVTDLGDKAKLITSNRFINTTYGGVGGANPQVHVGFSDYEIGKNLGELIVTACTGIDPCNVILEEGTLGSSPQIQRSKGAEEVIAANANIKVIDKQSNDFQQSKAIELTDQLLTKYQDINVIATHDDASAVGVVQSVEQAGRQKDITVIGVGGSKDGIKAIEDGRMYGTVWVSPKQDGVLALESMVSILKGEPVPDVADVEGRPTRPVPIVQVTKENVADYPGEW